MIDAEDAVVSLLSVLPSHQIEGKKRLQKMCHLLKEARAPLDVDFTLLHYGAFILPRKGFKQYEISDPIYFKNILVWSNIDGGPMPVADLLPGTANWAAPIRFYFRTANDRQRAAEIWQRL